MWDKHIKLISLALIPYTECQNQLMHKLRHYRQKRRNRTEQKQGRTWSRLLLQRVALQNNSWRSAIPLLEHTDLTEQGSQNHRLLKHLSNHFSFLFYSIFFNPQFWSLMYIIEASFTDELISLNSYNLSVIFYTTQCLLTQVCI